MKRSRLIVIAMLAALLLVAVAPIASAATTTYQAITSLSVKATDGKEYDATVDQATGTINVKVPSGTNITQLTVNYKLGSLDVVGIPASGTVRDLSKDIAIVLQNKANQTLVRVYKVHLTSGGGSVIPDTNKNRGARIMYSVGVYASASTSSKRLSTVSTDAYVTPVEYVSHTWLKVKWNDGYAYVPAAAADWTFSTACSGTVARSSYYYRLMTNNSSRILGTFPAGTELEILGRCGTWMNFYKDGRSTYIKAINVDLCTYDD